MNPLQIQMRKYDNCNVFFLGNSLKALLIGQIWLNIPKECFNV